MHLIWIIATAKAICAAVVTYNFDITWVTASPDGFTRPVIGINNRWPLPAIEANLGDNIVVNVRNMLGNETTGLHFHGQSQTGTNAMDGPVGGTQCGIPPGATFKYSFTVIYSPVLNLANPAGSFWYHSHSKGQYPDGLRGPLIVRDAEDPFLDKYDKELTLTVSDWYRSQMPALLEAYLSPNNVNGAEPVPNSALINDSSDTKFQITPGLTYRLRIISVAAFSAHYVQLGGHEMTIIAVDGINVVPQKVSSIYITAAQRYDVLLEAKDRATHNYAIISSMDQTMFDGYPNLPQIVHENATAYLVYDPEIALPPPLSVPAFQSYDDFKLVPLDKWRILGPVDTTYTVNMIFNSDENGINRAYINNQTYVSQKVPTLYTALSAPASLVMNPAIYGIASNPFVVKYNQVVEIVINNLDTGGHPWHIHGHQFQVVARSAKGVGTYDGSTGGFPSTPVRRDTVMVNKGGYAVFRFKANNPGVYLLHCHIDWHVDAGLTATILEAPDHLQATHQGLKIPADHLRVCDEQGIPTAGNAAGNTKNWLDLTGAPMKPPLVDYGSLVNPPSSRTRRQVNAVDASSE